MPSVCVVELVVEDAVGMCCRTGGCWIILGEVGAFLLLYNVVVRCVEI